MLLLLLSLQTAVSARLSVIPADEVVLLTHPAEDSTDDFGQNFGPRNCEKPDYHAMTCVCEGVLYNFSSLTPPNGKAWSGEVGSSHNTMFLSLNGIPSSVFKAAKCSIQEKESGIAAALQIHLTPLCIPLGKIDEQTWTLSTAYEPQVITVAYGGGDQGLSATLEVTCDTTAVTPRVDFVGQTNSSTYVVQITSKEACNYKKTTRAPSIDGLPYCPDDCASSWEKCIGNNYGSRACLEYANAGYLCSLRCDGTGFLSKNPLCPGEMRFVSCMRCQPTCSNSHPVECADSSKPCSAGCICPPDRPIWDDALGTCVDSQNCPRGGRCSQAILENYLGEPIQATYCPWQTEGSICSPKCQRQHCIPRPSFLSRDKYAILCGRLDQNACGVRKGSLPAADDYSHRCIWADDESYGGSGPTFTCTKGAWLVSDPGTCPLGNTGGNAGIVGPSCRAVVESACLSNPTGTPVCAYYPQSQQCQEVVQSASMSCKFACLGIEGGSTANQKKCAHCIYDAFATEDIEGKMMSAVAHARRDQDVLHLQASTLQKDQEETFGSYNSDGSVADGSARNITSIQACCGCLKDMFHDLNFIPPSLFVELMKSPCKTHDPLNDDDTHMDDDEVALEQQREEGFEWDGVAEEVAQLLDTASGYMQCAGDWLGVQVAALASATMHCLSVEAAEQE